MPCTSGPLILKSSKINLREKWNNIGKVKIRWNMKTSLTSDKFYGKLSDIKDKTGSLPITCILSFFVN